MSTLTFADLESDLDSEPTFLDAQVAYAVSKGSHGRVQLPRASNAKQDAVTRFATEHKDLLAYLGTRAAHWTFATSLLRQFGERGSLSPNQLSAAYRAMEQDAQRTLERVASKPASDVDLSSVPAGRYAVPNGASRLKVLIQRPDAPRKWSGWIFVSDAAEYGHRQKYGSQAPGRLYSGKISDALRTVAQDPKAAAIAYGHLTGTCCVCGRTLEDPESIAAGIGPICAQRF